MHYRNLLLARNEIKAHGHDLNHLDLVDLKWSFCLTPQNREQAHTQFDKWVAVELSDLFGFYVFSPNITL